MRTPLPYEEPTKSSPHAPGLIRVTPGPGTHKKRHFRWVWVVVVAGALLMGGTYWYTHRASAAGRGGPGGRNGFKYGFGAGMSATMPVVASPARQGALNIYLNGLGTVTPIANVVVRTQISGQLIQVAFQEGQEVKKGDLLAVIDPRPYQVAKEQAEGQFLQAQAQLQQAKADLSRYQTLAKEDSIAQQQVDAQVALVSQYEGLARTDQAAIDNAELNLTYCHIVAPVDGRVGLRQVDAGNYVTPGDANGIVVLTQLHPISVIFTLPEDDVGEVSQRLKSGASIPVDAYDRTMTKKLTTGTLATIDNEVDTTTGTIRLRAVFANDDQTLFANQFVNARMLLRVDRGAIIIPSAAVERGQNGAFVYVVQADKTVVARPVTLGPSEGERQEVRSGIKPGEFVVSDGADKLKDGMKVTVQAPASGASTRSANGQWKGQGAWGGPGQGASAGGQGSWGDWKAKMAAGGEAGGAQATGSDAKSGEAKRGSGGD